MMTPKMAIAGKKALVDLGYENVDFTDAQKVYEAMRKVAPREQEVEEAPVAWANSEELRDADLTIQKSARVYVRKRIGLDMALYAHPPLPADGWKEGIEAAAKVCQQWLDNYSTLAIDHSTPREYATDAVLDIKEVIEGLLQTPPASTEGGK